MMDSGTPDFAANQFVFRDPTIRDFYDTVADSILKTLTTGAPIRVRVRSKREGQLVRVRLSAIAKQRLNISWWHWCATRYTQQEPDTVYCWLAKMPTVAYFMSYYRNFAADKVMAMMSEPAICTVRLPAQRVAARKVELYDDDED